MSRLMKDPNGDSPFVNDIEKNQIEHQSFMRAYVIPILALPYIEETIEAVSDDYDFIDGFIIHGSCTNVEALDSIIKFLETPLIENTPKIRMISDVNVTFSPNDKLPLNEWAWKEIEIYRALPRMLQSIQKHNDGFDYHVKIGYIGQLSDESYMQIISRHKKLYQAILKSYIKESVLSFIAESPGVAKYFK